MTVNITATITDTAGNAVVGARVNAKLFVPDVLSDFVVPEDSNVTGTTDANGQSVLALWPNSSNTDINTYYRVRAWHPTTKAKIMDVCAYVDTAANLEDIAYNCRTASDDAGGTSESAALASHIANTNDPHAEAGYKKWGVLELDVSTDFTFDAIQEAHVYTLDEAAGEHEYSLIFISDDLAVADEIILVVPDVNATYTIGCASSLYNNAGLTVKDSFGEFNLSLYDDLTANDVAKWVGITRISDGEFYSSAKFDTGEFGVLYASRAVIKKQRLGVITTSHTLSLADAGKTIDMSSSYANSVIIPNHASVLLPYGYTVDVFQYGVGQTTISPALGVTVRSAKSMTLRARFSVATLECRAYNEWVLHGDLTA